MCKWKVFLLTFLIVRSFALFSCFHRPLAIYSINVIAYRDYNTFIQHIHRTFYVKRYYQSAVLISRAVFCKEVQIVYRLFLMNCYLLYVPRLPSQPASNTGVWVIDFIWLELARQYITMTRNDLSIIWISLVFWEVHKNTHAYSIKNVLLFFACFYVTSCQALKNLVLVIQRLLLW